MVIEKFEDKYARFGIYNLTEFGTRQLGSCMKNPFKDHSACCKDVFYANANPSDYTYDDHELLQASFDENLQIPNLDGQDDNLSSDSDGESFFDPCPTFDGKTLQNKELYICYLNALVNGLLSLSKFRQLIGFMEPNIENHFTKVLNDKTKNLERFRNAINNDNGNFPFGVHSDPCEALNEIIRLANLANLHDVSLVEI